MIGEELLTGASYASAPAQAILSARKQRLWPPLDIERRTFARPRTRQGRGVEQPNSAEAKRGHRHAIDQFVDRYCSEPHLAFNRIVVFGYRSHLDPANLHPAPIRPGPYFALPRTPFAQVS